MLVGLTHINVRDHFGVCGNNDPGDMAKIQCALDTAPIGCRLVIPTDIYNGSVPLNMTRHMDIDFQDAIVGCTSQNPLHDVLAIDICDASPQSDSRNLTITGGALSAQGRSAISVKTTHIGVNGLKITKGRHYGPKQAIYMNGLNTQFSTIEDNTLYNGVFMDKCSDGNRVHRNTIFGEQTGVIIDTVPGAYKTYVGQNTITSRDGALRVVDGSQVDFERNTVEQGEGWGVNQLHASVKIEGTTRIASGIRIIGNNFGNSIAPNNPHIWLQNAEECIIDGNDFHLRQPCDIKLDAGASYNKIGANRVKGIRSGDPTSMLLISDAGVGNFGVQHSAAYLGLQNGWTASSDFMFFKDQSGVVHFRGLLIAGTVASGSVIGTMPLGFRPANQVPALLFANINGSVAMLVFTTAGAIVCGSIPPSTNTVQSSMTMDALSYYSQWKTTYQAGP